MDLQILYLAALFSLLIFMFMAHKILTKKSDSTPSLPPGPRKLPIIGNMHNLVGSYPHRRLRDLSKKYGPLMHLKLGEISFIVVSSPECAREVLKTHDLNFASRPTILAAEILTYNSLGASFAPYGDYWRQLRKIFALELLSVKRVQSFQPIRWEEFNNLIKLVGSKEGSTVNLTKEVFTATSRITIRTAFGNKCKDNQTFISIIKQAIQIASGFDLGDLYPSAKWLQQISGLKPKLEKLHREADRIMQNIIDEHNKEAKLRATQGGGEEVKEDMIDVLLKFQHNQQEFHLTNDCIKAVIMDTFGGGTETSSTVISWTMSEIMKHPRVLKKVQAEVREVFEKEGKPSESGVEKLKYLKAVVKEALRLHPPGVLLLPRECGQACEIMGYHIPLKSKVVINAWALGRHPNSWTDPETFYPERFIDSSVDYKGNHYEFIPFGAGRRICPGILYGMVNVELPLALLLYHFDWKLPNGMKNEDLDMTEAFGAAVTRREDLYLIPTTYHHP